LPTRIFTIKCQTPYFNFYVLFWPKTSSTYTATFPHRHKSLPFMNLDFPFIVKKEKKIAGGYGKVHGNNNDAIQNGA
jgi:hypothetical protein